MFSQGSSASAAVAFQAVWFAQSLAQGEGFGPALLRTIPSLGVSGRMDRQLLDACCELYWECAGWVKINPSATGGLSLL